MKRRKIARRRRKTTKEIETITTMTVALKEKERKKDNQNAVRKAETVAKKPISSFVKQQ